MIWCDVHTNEYDLQAVTYPTTCPHHKLRNNDENKIPVFPECICNTWQNMMQQTSQTHDHGKNDNYGKSWYFRFDDDNNMSYRYILSITWIEMGQLNTYNPIYFNDKCNREDTYRHTYRHTGAGLESFALFSSNIYWWVQDQPMEL